LSDFYPHGRVAQTFGVLRSEGYSERAIFVIDKNCVIRYVDVHDIDDQPDNEVLFKVLEQISGKKAQAAATAVQAAATPGTASPVTPLPAEAMEVDVVMYCTQWCPACRRARAFFQQYGIKFAEVDIARNREAAAQVRRWNNGNEITPTFDVKGKILPNFNRSELAEALGIREE
jgi:glutaredoxin